MSQAPHVIRGARKGLRLGQGKLEDSLMVALLDSYAGLYMAQTSDRVAAKYGITREEQDAYALSSQKRAGAAKYYQLYYDQYLPPAVGQAVNDATQGLFAGTSSPEDVAKTIEEAAAAELKK